MPRELVLKDGVLSAVVTSYEQVELAQLEAEWNAKEQVAEEKRQAEAQVRAEREEAEAGAADAKSEFEVGKGLVENPPADAASEYSNDPAADGVDIPVAVA